MTSIRRFRIAPSLVRLAATAVGTSQRREAHFDADAGRNAHVVFEEDRAYLVATVSPDGAGEEERHEVPLAHGEAVADVAKSSIERERCVLAVEGGLALVDRYSPSKTDVVTVEFADAASAAAFTPPKWFGTEVTKDPAFEARGIAFAKIPVGTPPDVSGVALDALLDTLDSLGASLRQDQRPREIPARAERLRAVS